MTVKEGFTLIELSIVLVIIGLIVGGVLVGQDLIRAAAVRAQVTQIEKFNTAVNTFHDKFGYLPGDLTPAAVTQFGFTVGNNCTGLQGARNGNGVIEGWSGVYVTEQGNGETALFWQDLSTAGFIEGKFPNGNAPNAQCLVNNGAISVSGATISTIFPVAKIGYGNYLYVYPANGVNYFGLSAITSNDLYGNLFSNANIPVAQAYNIDQKVDDGIPTSGNVQATYVNGYLPTSNIVAAPNSNISGGTSSSCYDTVSNTYSIKINNGAGKNCALSFRFQ